MIHELLFSDPCTVRKSFLPRPTAWLILRGMQNRNCTLCNLGFGAWRDGKQLMDSTYYANARRVSRDWREWTRHPKTFTRGHSGGTQLQVPTVPEPIFPAPTCPSARICYTLRAFANPGKTAFCLLQCWPRFAERGAT